MCDDDGWRVCLQQGTCRGMVVDFLRALVMWASVSALTFLFSAKKNVITSSTQLSVQFGSWRDKGWVSAAGQTQGGKNEVASACSFCVCRWMNTSTSFTG